MSSMKVSRATGSDRIGVSMTMGVLMPLRRRRTADLIGAGEPREAGAARVVSPRGVDQQDVRRDGDRLLRGDQLSARAWPAVLNPTDTSGVATATLP
jgi:hypothetical protein